MKFTCVLLIITGLLLACTDQKAESPKLRIALTPWPGAEFLYLAQELGYFEQLGLNAEIVQLANFSDARQAFSAGKVNAITQTVFELIQSHQLGGRKAKAVLLTDFSNGGDVLLARDTIKNIAQLKGQTIATDYSAISLFFIRQSLKSVGLALEDVKLINADESTTPDLLLQQKVDAAYSYPPYSNLILQQQGFHVINDSKSMPHTIIDTLTVAQSYLDQAPQENIALLKQAWQMSLDYAAQHPVQAYSIMAKREQLELKAFLMALEGVEVLSITEQEVLLNDSERLQSLVTRICEVLTLLDTSQVGCPKPSQIFYNDPKSAHQ